MEHAVYREQMAEWEKIYGTDSHKQDKESVLERLKNPPKRAANYQQQKTAKSKDRGARWSIGLYHMITFDDKHPQI